MRNAQAMLDSAIRRRESIPRQWLMQYDEDNFRQAEATLRDAESHLQAGNFSAALLTAQEGLSRMSDTAGRVVALQRENQNAYQEALTAFEEANAMVQKLDTTEMKLWFEKEFSVLSSRVQQYEQVPMQTTEGYILLRKLCLDAQAEARKLHDQLNEARRQHYSRREMLRGLVRALSTEGEYRPLKPGFARENDPWSEIVLATEHGPVFYIALDGQVITRFPPDHDHEKDDQWKQHFQDICREQQFALISFDPVAHEPGKIPEVAFQSRASGAKGESQGTSRS
jgi:hypothetical protein